MSSHELKPCPFCGEKEPVQEWRSGIEYVVCPECGAQVGGWGVSAIAEWNRRATVTEEQAKQNFKEYLPHQYIWEDEPQRFRLEGWLAALKWIGVLKL